MSKGTYNQVTLVGNLGKDPTVKYTAEGLAIANITIATQDTYKDKKTNEKMENVQWHWIVFIGTLAELIDRLGIKKGDKVLVEGKLQTRKWKDKDGLDKYKTEVLGRQLRILSPKKVDDSNVGNMNEDSEIEIMDEEVPF